MSELLSIARGIAIVGAWVFLVGALEGCGLGEQQVTGPPASAEIKVDPYEGATSFPYTASPRKRQRILNTIPSVDLGMSRVQVYKLLGPPDIYQADARMESPEIIGWTMKYIFSSQSREANRNDAVLSIDFDKDDRCERIYPQNLPMIEKRGS